MNQPVRLLIIDDEAAVRKFLRVGLETKGYEIAEAVNAAEGLGMVATFKPDLLILDLGLPDRDGFEVLASLREWSQVPVVVLTVRDSDEDKIRLLEGGADDYLTKPFSLPELIVRLKVALRHAASGVPLPYFKTGRLEISYAERTARWQGDLLKLTSTEYRLLCLLAQGQGKVVTQKQLVDEIWGPTSGETAHYLRVYIGHLRKKLDTDPAQPSLIVTETGVGYRLNIDGL